MMISINRILFPTDFSASAKKAQQYAVALSERFGSELHLIHVVPPMIPYPDAASPYLLPMEDNQKQVELADQHLRRELEPAWVTRHNPKFVTVSGFAVDEILKYANETNVDLIVVGTHGHTGLSRMLIGSVAEKIVRTASCPVLTVHPKGHQFVI